MKLKYYTVILVIITFCNLLPAWSLPVENIRLPKGFKIGVYTDHIPNPREMVFSPSGILFAGSFNAGKVYALTGKEKAERIYIVADGLRLPAGVAYYNKSLYISSVNKILRLDNIEERLDNPPIPVLVNGSFPDEYLHGWKFIRFGPDGLLYVPVGAPCNVCLPDDPRFETILRMDPGGDNLEIYAKGIRNSVGFDWHPVTKELWFTDNGRDYLGDNMPPDELNKAPVKGMNFGFPYIHGRNIIDPDFKDKIPGNFKFSQPEMELGPHVASLGMRFYTGKQFPKEYVNRIFIAEHGSWNRSIPSGYRITMVTLDDSGKHAAGYEVFAYGWLKGNYAWGRPADVEVGPDGSLFVSDDKADAIYRIFYDP